MALSGGLRYIPVRQSPCMISSSILLLKSIKFGAKHMDLSSSLEVLDQYIIALRSSPIDDMDFSFQYATLISEHVAEFRKAFTISDPTR